MDSTDREIEFDENEICNHCKNAQKKLQERNFYLDNETKKNLLERKINEIKEKGKNKQYDCVIDISDGADSTFVAYKVKKLGLRPLAFHFDNGWNSKLLIRILCVFRSIRMPSELPSGYSGICIRNF